MPRQGVVSLTLGSFGSSLIHRMSHLQLFVGKAWGADALLHFGQKMTRELVIDLDIGLDPILFS